MNGITLYAFPGRTRAERVMWTLGELNLDYTLIFTCRHLLLSGYNLGTTIRGQVCETHRKVLKPFGISQGLPRHTEKLAAPERGC